MAIKEKCFKSCWFLTEDFDHSLTFDDMFSGFLNMGCWNESEPFFRIKL